MAHEFKMGDRVIINSNRLSGTIGTIGSNVYGVELDDGYIYWCTADDLTAKPSRPPVSPRITTKEDYAAFVKDKLEGLQTLIKQKNTDYSPGNDAFLNFRTSEELGISAFAGANVRLLDKVMRIKAYVKSGNLVNESIEDAYLDLIGYSLICLGLLEEEKRKKA